MIETKVTPAVAEQAPARSRPYLNTLLEWRIVAFMIIGMLLVTAIPYLYAAATTPADKVYTGLMLGVPDHLQYFSWMRDLAQQPLAANRLTPEPNEPAFFNLLWWAMGRIGAITGLEIPALYTLLRIWAVALVMSAAYGFYTVTVSERSTRRLAFLIFACAGGMGIIWVVVKYLARLADVPFPDDIYSSEANTFFMSLAFPHFTLATALLTATFAFTLQALRKHRLIYAVAAGVAAVLLGLQHTYDLITVYSVLGIFGILSWARDRRFPTFLLLCGLIVVGMSAPPALYMFLLVQLNPIWGEVLAQFDNAGVFTPPLYHLLILLGVPFWLALLAFRPKMLQSKSDAELFVAVWFVAHFGLAYIPTDFQIHMILGWQVPMAILAAMALTKIVWPWLQKRGRLVTGLATAVLVGAALGTNVYILGWRMLDLGRHEKPYFLMTNEVAALNWLEQHTTRGDVVLADLSLGQFVPMWSDARSFLAHWANTLDYFGKIESVKQVMDPQTQPAERDALLDQFAVTYLIYRGQETPPWAQLPRYEQTFQQGEVVIYRVVR
jgi:hypothetical protein